MSLIAGIVSRRPGQAVPASVCEALSRLISRDRSDEISTFFDKQSYLIKVDIGAFGEDGFKVDREGNLTLLAGEPLLSFAGPNAWRSREVDVALIHDGCVRGDLDVLKNSQGVFSIANYQPATGTVTLISDKLCIRPLYYWIDDDYVIFASALRILEGIAEIPKQMSLPAVTEIVCLGYPLGNRTPYTNIFLLEAGEIVEIRAETFSRRHYWRWDDIPPSAKTEEALLQDLYDRFEDAVKRRSRGDTTTFAYLSGGLDSRCVVAALHSNNVRVHTFNFARPNTQDQVFGLDFARQVDSLHEEVPKQAGDHVPDYSSLMAKAWNASENRQTYPAERPSLCWSGEGGSVALGHVHINEKIVELMRAQQFDAAIEVYLERETMPVPSRLLRPDVFAVLSRVAYTGIREQLDGLHSKDPARTFYLFLMLNDQRRKLASHYENLDLHRLEFQLPFFDSTFVGSILSIPIDLCLRHKFYAKWLTLFEAAVTAVPWQAYPGHAPCPVPAPQGLAYQWAEEYQTAEQMTQKQRLRSKAFKILRAPDFPKRILSRRNLRLASWIHAAGWRDYGYFIDAAGTYHDYWKKCDGKYVLASQ